MAAPPAGCEWSVVWGRRVRGYPHGAHTEFSYGTGLDAAQH